VKIHRGWIALAAFSGAFILGWLYILWQRSWHEDLVPVALANNGGAAANDEIIERAVLQVASLPELSREVDGPAPGQADREPAEIRPDEEWAALIRSSFELEETLRKPDLLTAKQLLRNRRLNPGDVVVPIGLRRGFDEWLSKHRSALVDLLAVTDKVAMQELNFMIDNRVARSRSYSEYVDSLGAEQKKVVDDQREAHRVMMQKAGLDAASIETALAKLRTFDEKVIGGAFCYAVRDGDDAVYLGDLKAMPQARQSANAYSSSCMAFYWQMLGFFRVNAQLPETEQTLLMSAIEKGLTRYSR